MNHTSNGEFATQADIGSEVGFVAKDVASRWQSEALQISRMLGALIKSLEQ
ncbi:four helix bundle protein [Vibrio chagasii]|uniref:four helix bundle protein n=1 Tax=Vibrio chagasii TaxID=170679 RepID=UPI003D9FC3E8